MERIVLLSLAGVFSSMLSSASAWGQLAPNDLMITHYSPRYNTASDEYIVLFNNTNSAINMNGYEFAYSTAAGVISVKKSFTATTVVAARAYYLLSPNISVTVGSVSNKPTDATYSAGLADAGQVAFRKTSDGSVIFALATGAITTFAFGQTTSHTTTTSGSSQGAFQLTASGSTYTRTSDNNADYTLVAAASISQVPCSGDAPLPVELDSFTALAYASKVKLNWSTATEVNNYGFEIERAIHNGLDGLKDWSKIGFVDGHGTTNAPQNYSYTDDIFSAGAFLYRLKQIDRDGAFQYSDTVEVTAALKADDYHLDQNFPNPFNPSTTIRFAVKSPQRVSLKVYNMLGQEVRTLFNQEAEAGVVYAYPFDGSGLSSGVYYYRLRTVEHTELKKMLMLK
jgi:hypothetical protein